MQEFRGFDKLLRRCRVDLGFRSMGNQVPSIPYGLHLVCEIGSISRCAEVCQVLDPFVRITSPDNVFDPFLRDLR